MSADMIFLLIKLCTFQLSLTAKGALRPHLRAAGTCPGNHLAIPWIDVFWQASTAGLEVH